MKNFILFLSLLCLGVTSQSDNLYASCPNTVIVCQTVYAEGGSGNNIVYGYLFGGKSVPSYYHFPSCRARHYSHSQLTRMCQKTYGAQGCTFGCEASYAPL